MLYKASLKGKIFSYKWVILFSFTLLPLLFKVLTIGTPKAYIFAIFLVFIWLLFCFPQLYLIEQYRKATTYDSIDINYNKKEITVLKDNQLSILPFADIRKITCYKPHAPIHYGSLWLTLCTGFYYYKIDFYTGSYYLTSLLFPNPELKGELDFYDSYIEVKTLYANIKGTPDHQES